MMKKIAKEAAKFAAVETYKAVKKIANEGLGGPYTSETKALMDAAWSEIVKGVASTIKKQAEADDVLSVSFNADFNIHGKIRDGVVIYETQGSTPEDIKIDWRIAKNKAEIQSPDKEKLKNDVLSAWNKIVSKYLSKNGCNVAWEKQVKISV